MITGPARKRKRRPGSEAFGGLESDAVNGKEKEILAIAIFCATYLLISGRRLKILPPAPKSR